MITKANSVSKNKEIPVNAHIWNAAFYLMLPIELNAVLLTLPFPGKAQCISNWFTLITHFVLGFANSSPSAAHNFSPLLGNSSWLTPINPTWSLSSIFIITPPEWVNTAGTALLGGNFSSSLCPSFSLFHRYQSFPISDAGDVFLNLGARQSSLTGGDLNAIISGWKITFRKAQPTTISHSQREQNIPLPFSHFTWRHLAWAGTQQTPWLE